MEEKRQRDFDHLKLMIDLHRHMALLSFAGLILTANLSRNIFELPKHEFFSFGSVIFFFVSVVASLLSQVNHIDKARSENIYEVPLPNKFAIPIAASMLGLIFGLLFLAAFVIVNWW